MSPTNTATKINYQCLSTGIGNGTKIQTQMRAILLGVEASISCSDPHILPLQPLLDVVYEQLLPSSNVVERCPAQYPHTA
eukprot:991548-Amphidinium_carterae.1